MAIRERFFRKRFFFKNIPCGEVFSFHMKTQSSQNISRPLICLASTLKQHKTFVTDDFKVLELSVFTLRVHKTAVLTNVPPLTASCTSCLSFYRVAKGQHRRKNACLSKLCRCQPGVKLLPVTSELCSDGRESCVFLKTLFISGSDYQRS